MLQFVDLYHFDSNCLQFFYDCGCCLHAALKIDDAFDQI